MTHKKFVRRLLAKVERCIPSLARQYQKLGLSIRVIIKDQHPRHLGTAHYHRDNLGQVMNQRVTIDINKKLIDNGLKLQAYYTLVHELLHPIASHFEGRSIPFDLTKEYDTVIDKNHPRLFWSLFKKATGVSLDDLIRLYKNTSRRLLKQ